MRPLNGTEQYSSDYIMLDDIENIQDAMIRWENENYQAFPWRETDNHFHALIAEMMLQRTKAEQVLPIYNEFIHLYSSLEKLTEDRESQLRTLLKPLGLNWRINNIVKTISILSEQMEIPVEYDSLTKLPGVGQYVASAFLSFHTKQRHPIIDSNAVRLWGRVFGFQTDSETRRKKWFRELVDVISPQNDIRLFNYAILDVTRAICKGKPLCSDCPLSDICQYEKGKYK